MPLVCAQILSHSDLPYLFELRHPLELMHPQFFDLVNIKIMGMILEITVSNSLKFTFC